MAMAMAMATMTPLAAAPNDRSRAIRQTCRPSPNGTEESNQGERGQNAQYHPPRPAR
jgi:hypothetical protein